MRSGGLALLSLLVLGLAACTTLSTDPSAPQAPDGEAPHAGQPSGLADEQGEPAPNQAGRQRHDHPHHRHEHRTEPEATADEMHDLWSRIRQGLELGDQSHPRVDSTLSYFTRHPTTLNRIVDRAQRYLFYVVEEVEQRGLPMELALLPIVESGLQPFAYSSAHAAGLWQFIPSTGRLYGLKQNWWYDGRRDIVESTRAALDYLQKLQTDFGGDWLLAIAAYNSGEGTVRRAILKNHRRGKSKDFWFLDLPRETRVYVPRLLALSAIVADPEHHGVMLSSIPNRPYFERVQLKGPIDLALAAELADISVEELYLLNPAFNRWATAPDGPHHILLPIANAATFEARAAQLPPDRRVQWKRHRIRGGETLSEIARRYRLTISVLKQVNDLEGSLIRAGDSLLIPLAARPLAAYTLSADVRKARSQGKKAAGTQLATYVVRKGDSLWNIARNHSMSTEQLASWNRLSTGDIIRPGQRLAVWSSVDGVPLPSRRSSAARNDPLFEKGTRRHIRYVVKRGDSLWMISRRFKVSIPALRDWNEIPEGMILKPGQTVDVFVDEGPQQEST